MRGLLIGAGVLALGVLAYVQFFQTPSLPARPHVQYALSYEMHDGTPSVVVNLRFPGDNDGSTWLALPNEWGGQVELYSAISELVIHTEGAELVATDNPSLFDIQHAPGAELEVAYRLIDEWDGPPEPFHGNPYRPIINEVYLHMIGWAVWALPQWDDWPGENPDVDFSLDWSGLPADWSVADNFGAGRNVRSLSGPLNRLQAGLLVAGDFRVLSVDVDGAPVNLAIRGEWTFSDAEFMDGLVAVIQSQRTFWREQSQEDFLVTLIPQHRREGQEGSRSNGGTQLMDAFALFSTTNMELGEFDWLTAHELQHRWIPNAFGMAAAPEEEIYWFSEGFTDYYSTLLSFRAGMFDLQGYANETNEAIQEYYRSPVQEAPVVDVISGFWDDRNLQRLPYQQGRLLAARWNRELMEISSGTFGLDEIMMILQDNQWAAMEAGETVLLDNETIIAAFTNRFYEQPGEDLEQYVISGEAIPIEHGMFGPCFDARNTEFPTFDLGFDMGASAETYTFTAVAENGPAYAAGLREGWRVAGWSFLFDDPYSEVVLQAVPIDGSVQQEIRYFPRGAETEIIPQLFLAADLSEEDRASCRAWLGASD